VQISCTQEGKSKKFTLQIARGESKEKKITGRKNKTRSHYRRYQSIYPLFFENLSSFYFGLTRG
jgi:hypothetical protein